MNATSQNRPALAALSAGLVLSILSTAAPYVDHAGANVLADHIRAGYPSYTESQVDHATSVWIAILTVIGVLGCLGWLAAMWILKARKSWAPWAVVGLFLIGTGLAMAAAWTKDTSADSGLAPQLGLVGLAPSLAGLLAVALIWRRR